MSDAALTELERLTTDSIVEELRRIDARQVLLRGLLQARRRLDRHERDWREGDRILGRDRRPAAK